jgi:hypothetical protein
MGIIADFSRILAHKKAERENHRLTDVDLKRRAVEVAERLAAATPDDDAAVHEFGHAVATRLRKLSWFALHWPQDEMAGFRLYHEIAAEADKQLKELLRRVGR